MSIQLRARFVLRADAKRYPTHPYELIVEQRVVPFVWRKVHSSGGFEEARVLAHGEAWVKKAVADFLELRQHQAERKAAERETRARVLAIVGPVIDVDRAALHDDDPEEQE